MNDHVRMASAVERRHAAGGHPHARSSGSASRVGDIVVMACILAISVAVAIGLNARLGSGPLAAGSAGLGVLLVLSMLHVLVRCSREIALLRQRVALLEGGAPVEAGQVSQLGGSRSQEDEARAFAAATAATAVTARAAQGNAIGPVTRRPMPASAPYASNPPAPAASPAPQSPSRTRPVAAGAPVQAAPAGTAPEIPGDASSPHSDRARAARAASIAETVFAEPQPAAAEQADATDPAPAKTKRSGLGGLFSGFSKTKAAKGEDISAASGDDTAVEAAKTAAQGHEAPGNRPRATPAPTAAEATKKPADAPPSAGAPPSDAPQVEGKKRGGLFSGLRRRGKPAEDVHQAQQAPVFANPSPDGPPRQRVVAGWQGKSEPLQRIVRAGGPQIDPMPSAPPAGAVRKEPQMPDMPHAARPRAAVAGTPSAEEPAPRHEAPRHEPLAAAPQAERSPPPNAPEPNPASPVESLIHEIAHKLSAEIASEGGAVGALRALPPPSSAPQLGHADADDDITPELAELAELVAEAVEDGSVEIYLQPILALDGLATVSYEVYPRLRTRQGEVLAMEEYGEVAVRTGLAQGIEKLTLLRTVNVLQQMEARGKLSPIFVNISPDLLLDGHFFAEVIDVMRDAKSLSNYLVLQFSQSAAETFGEAEFDGLDALARLGFTFGLTYVDHIEMDFEALITRGLAFVKVPADSFANGLLAGETVVPTAEIRDLFEEPGLQLIVHDIEQEPQLDVALNHGVVYGQGGLFAEPKPVRGNVAGDSHAAA